MWMMLFVALHIHGFESAQTQIQNAIKGYGWNLTTSAINFDKDNNEVDLYFYRILPENNYESKTITIKNIYRENILVSSITNNPSDKILVLVPNQKPTIRIFAAEPPK